MGAELVKGYQRRGYRVFCFAFHDSHGPIRDDLESYDIECLDLNYLSFPRGIKRRITYQWRLARLLQRRAVTALHVHHTSALILCGLAGRAARVRSLLMTEHAIHELEADPAFKRAARFYCKLAHQITVVHPALIEYFKREIHVSADRVHCVPNGVVIPDISDRPRVRASTRAQFNSESEDFIFLFAGRLHHTKDLPTLLSAVKIVTATRRCKVWLVGDGPDRSMLESITREVGLAAVVQFLGATSNVAPYLKSADAFVMSSATEGMPMVLLEAMASRLPCIATNVGGIPGLLGDGTGIVVPPRDPSRLADAMVRLIDDEQLRSRMSARGLEKILCEFDLERVVDQYLDLMRLPRHISSVPPRTSASKNE